MEPVRINEALARKVLEVVDQGLVHGMGKPVPGQMCIEAAVNFAMGRPHGDEPDCVAPSLRRLKIRLNDSNWSSPTARAKGLRRLGLAQLGSAGEVLNEVDFAKRVARLAIQTCVPQAMRSAASIAKGERKEQLLNVAALCEREPTEANARVANKIASADASASADDASAAAYADDASAAAYAAAYAADASASAAASADDAYAADASADASASADDASAASASADASASASASSADDAYAASYAASASASAAASAASADASASASASASSAAGNARDTSLAAFAEGVVQILVEMKAPGCEWLFLTEGGDVVTSLRGDSIGAAS